MTDTLNNQLAQVCNNLYCLLQDVEYLKEVSRADDKEAINKIISELEVNYNTLFKLIYGNK